MAGVAGCADGDDGLAARAGPPDQNFIIDHGRDQVQPRSPAVQDGDPGWAVEGRQQRFDSRWTKRVISILPPLITTQ